MTGRRIRFAVIALNLVILSAQASVILAAEKLVGLQSAPSIAMALPWFAEEARLYPKYDLDFQLVYIASSGIVTAAMSGGNGSVAIVGGEGPIRAFLERQHRFRFHRLGEKRPDAQHHGQAGNQKAGRSERQEGWRRAHRR